MKTQACIWLSPEDRATLEGWVADRNTPQKLVWRSRIVLLSADRVGKMAIVRAVGKCKRTVDRTTRSVPLQPGKPARHIAFLPALAEAVVYAAQAAPNCSPDFIELRPQGSA